MLIRSLQDCTEFIAGDNTILREILHPDKEALALGYSLAHASVAPGLSSIDHSLRTSEVYYILEGEGLMHIDSQTRIVKAGDTVYIPPQARQHIENISKTEILKFICIVDPAWQAEDEIVYS